jgi:ABC-type transport system substrate-binding protein
MQNRKPYAVLALAAMASMVLSACSQAAPVVQTVVVTSAPAATAEPQVVESTVVVKETQVVEVTAAPAAEWTTPHPILGDVKVRQAIAHCTDRDALISVSYPFLSEEDRAKLRMDTWMPKTSPFHANPNNIDYTFDITAGGKLLDDAGWKLPEGGTVRENANGEPLTVKFTTTNAQFRQTWAAVFEKQMASCGIIIQRSHIPGSIWFGSASGLQRRDFELGAFAWVGQADPAGVTTYACNQIPTPANNWSGQNYMGWCNKDADSAIRNANNTLSIEDRKKFYSDHQDQFMKDMVSLPLFQRAEAGAYTNKLKNIKFNPTEYYSANASEWEGKDIVVLAFTQEPASMFSLVESAAVQRTVAQLNGGVSSTQYDFAYQPVTYADDKFPSIENGGSTNEDVALKDGDKFVATDGNVYALKGDKVVTLKDGVATDEEAKDIMVRAKDGTEAAAAVGAKSPQIVTNFKFKPDVWSDGEPVVKADYELGYKVDCDRTSGAVSYDTCDKIATVDFIDDNSFKVTYVPGYQYAFYYLAPFSTYPSHQEIKSEGAYKGKKLSEVAPKDFATLPEIAEIPLGTGPFILTSWEKGQRMTLEANPNFQGAVKPQVKKVVVQFFGDTTGAVAALLAGDVDLVGTETLGAGSEVQAVLDAKEQGKAIEVFTEATPTWEHIDFNLNIK